MKHVVRHIEYLIQCNDYVVIPGIGAIIAHGKPAVYDSVTSTWSSPSRTFTFNPAQTVSDKLLEKSVARSSRISIEEAEKIVTRACCDMSNELASTGVLDLGLAGRISSRNNAMTYEPGVCSGALSQLWLPDVKFAPIATAAGVAREAEKESEHRAGIMRVALRRAGQAAACIAVLLTLGWVAMRNLDENPGEQMASVAPSPARPLIEVPGNSDATFVLVINRHDDASVEVEPKPEKPVSQSVVKSDDEIGPSDAEIRMNDSDSFCLVVASLASLEEAQKYVSQHTDINLRILTIDGRYRVYAATGRTAVEALQSTHNTKISSRYGNAWACPR